VVAAHGESSEEPGLDDMSEVVRHSAVEVARDRLGVVIVCSCNRWGYAGPDDARAEKAFSDHVEEARRDDDTGHTRARG
jgi:hypothetical protein